MNTLLPKPHNRVTEPAARAFAVDKLKHSRKRLDDDEACNHAFRVSATLKEMGYGEDIVIAALLHDVVEDTETTEPEILAAFGPEITRIVIAVTHDSSLKGKAKKEDLLRKVSGGGEKSIIVKLSDNCDNIRTIEFMKLWKIADYLDYSMKVHVLGTEALGKNNALVKLHKERLKKAVEKSKTIAEEIAQICM